MAKKDKNQSEETKEKKVKSEKPEKSEKDKSKKDKAEKPDKKADKSDKKDKKNKKGAAKGVPTTGTPSSGAAPTAAQGSVPGAGAPSLPQTPISPEQMTPTQLEQAIRDSNDPESRLKKLRNPFNVRSCLLNVLILIVMTLAIVVIWCAISVDKFNFVTVVKDMSYQFGITQGFQWLWAQITGWFH